MFKKQNTEKGKKHFKIVGHRRYEGENEKNQRRLLPWEYNTEEEKEEGSKETTLNAFENTIEKYFVYLKKIGMYVYIHTHSLKEVILFGVILQCPLQEPQPTLQKPQC